MKFFTFFLSILSIAASLNLKAQDTVIKTIHDLDSIYDSNKQKVEFVVEYTNKNYKSSKIYYRVNTALWQLVDKIENPSGSIGSSVMVTINQLTLTNYSNNFDLVFVTPDGKRINKSFVFYWCKPRIGIKEIEINGVKQVDPNNPILFIPKTTGNSNDKIKFNIEYSSKCYSVSTEIRALEFKLNDQPWRPVSDQFKPTKQEGSITYELSSKELNLGENALIIKASGNENGEYSNEISFNVINPEMQETPSISEEICSGHGIIKLVAYPKGAWIEILDQENKTQAGVVIDQDAFYLDPQKAGTGNKTLQLSYYKKGKTYTAQKRFTISDGITTQPFPAVLLTGPRQVCANQKNTKYTFTNAASIDTKVYSYIWSVNSAMGEIITSTDQPEIIINWKKDTEGLNYAFVSLTISRKNSSCMMHETRYLVDINPASSPEPASIFFADTEKSLVIGTGNPAQKYYWYRNSDLDTITVSPYRYFKSPIQNNERVWLKTTNDEMCFQESFNSLPETPANPVSKSGFSEKPDSKDILVYPNPVNNELTVQSKLPLENITIEICSLNGLDKLTLQNVNLLSPVKFNVSRFKPGIYIYRVIKDNETICSEKFIKK